MKSTGMVRSIDELGRVSIPKEIRMNLGIKVHDAIEFYVDEDKLILKKYQPGCLFCGNLENVTMFRNKLICRDCLEEMKKSLQY